MKNTLKLINDFDEELLFTYNPEEQMLIIQGFCGQTFFIDEATKMQIIQYLDGIFNQIAKATKIKIHFTAEHLDSKVFKFLLAYLKDLQNKGKPISFFLEVGKNHEVYCNVYNQAAQGFEVKVINED